jgi:hypothetical protein
MLVKPCPARRDVLVGAWVYVCSRGHKRSSLGDVRKGCAPGRTGFASVCKHVLNQNGQGLVMGAGAGMWERTGGGGDKTAGVVAEAGVVGTKRRVWWGVGGTLGLWGQSGGCGDGDGCVGRGWVPWRRILAVVLAAHGLHQEGARAGFHAAATVRRKTIQAADCIAFEPRGE